MSSKLENVAVIDSNTIANNIMSDIIDVERMERMMGSELSSEDLFRIDCAILSSLRKTKDFSRDLLEQLETGIFKSPQDELQNAPNDITLPIQNLFNEIANFITDEALEGVKL